MFDCCGESTVPSDGLASQQRLADMRSIIRGAQDRRDQPSAGILDGGTLQSTCESRPRTGCDGYKGKQGSNVHLTIERLGQLPAVHVRPANERQRA